MLTRKHTVRCMLDPGMRQMKSWRPAQRRKKRVMTNGKGEIAFGFVTWRDKQEDLRSMSSHPLLSVPRRDCLGH